jgi:cardiolipin synthase
VPTPRNTKILWVLALTALIIQSGLLLLALFAPGLPYRVARGAPERLSEPHFQQMLAALTGAELRQWSDMQVLTNGDRFYEAELEAIRAAKKTINLEAYIFGNGEVTRRFVEALTERARAGVQVNLTIDAIGAFAQTKQYFHELTSAGGQIQWYHPVRWNTWPRINNRTHRELIIIDGEIGFIGGAGFADQWLKGDEKNPQWRDTMVRVEGAAVTGLQAAFAENWLESSGEILTGVEYFPFTQSAVRTPALVVASSPTTGRSTEARILFQTLLASASKSIHITTPYFLPDQSARAELAKAVKRGVEVSIIAPGKHNDHLLTRRSSRRLYGDLLQTGARIFEYQPSMIHAKIMVIDGLWSVVGSTNFDSRSFGINDEVNMAVIDETFAQRLDKDFQRDLSQSREISYEEWKNRPIYERVSESFGAVLERQQ